MFATAEKFPSDTLSQSWTEMKHSCQKAEGGKEDTKLVQRAFCPPSAQLPVFPAWNHNSRSAKDGHTGHKKSASRPEINTPLLLGNQEENLSTRVSSSPLCVLCYFGWNFSLTSPIICLQGGWEATLNMRIGSLHHRHSAIFIPSWFTKRFKASFMWIYFFSMKTPALQGAA